MILFTKTGVPPCDSEMVFEKLGYLRCSITPVGDDAHYSVVVTCRSCGDKIIEHHNLLASEVLDFIQDSEGNH